MSWQRGWMIGGMLLASLVGGAASNLFLTARLGAQGGDVVTASQINIVDREGRLRAVLAGEAVGLCHSDVAQLNGHPHVPGEVSPTVPGHEIVGRVQGVFVVLGMASPKHDVAAPAEKAEQAQKDIVE